MSNGYIKESSNEKIPDSMLDVETEKWGSGVEHLGTVESGKQCTSANIKYPNSSKTKITFSLPYIKNHLQT